MYNKVNTPCRKEAVPLEVCGIIAEFDPFHKGHQHLISEARRLSGCEYVVCVLSTSFLQRGTPGLFSTRDRTRMALAGGADAVFALPVSFSCAPADRFALGGTALLRAMGTVTSQAFGCENAADFEQLRRAAVFLNEEPSAFRTALHEALNTGISYPAAQARALRISCGIPVALLSAPNNILAVAYLRQLARSDAAIRPVAVHRIGSRTNPEADGYLPSSAVRRMILEGQAEKAAGSVPASSMEIIAECLEARRFCPPEALTQALFYRLNTSIPTDWAPFLTHGEGLEQRLQKVLEQHPESIEALLSGLKTKRYTHAALRRWLSRILLDLPTDSPAEPACLRLLGFRQSARPLLRAIREQASFPVVTKPADGRKYLEADARAEMVWSLGAGRPAALYEQSPVIL